MPADGTRSARIPRGLLDTNILIHLARLDQTVLPDEASVSAITFAELAAGIHATDDALERAARLDVLQRAEAVFEPLPFDAEAARSYGQVIAAVRNAGRSPRARVAEQMIAAIAASRGLPLYTTNVEDFLGLAHLLRVVPVGRPSD
ncbi:type II toxin-antitoxin system VapC family toxin [Agromyces archimandritae]|uniref:Ribonuclease VapC n=1 Tax=Agromyces archimandritae TaxID=2781962 RepID=A0A975FLF1_9MICO|nr:type II toxin-antitoxin system VapC family toxin [Agromyces archimandritae]QTX04094.1 type II toxin-antitoxin system VapC family toxin [Agromyces archimandritae]